MGHLGHVGTVGLVRPVARVHLRRVVARNWWKTGSGRSDRDRGGSARVGIRPSLARGRRRTLGRLPFHGLDGAHTITDSLRSEEKKEDE